MLSSLSDKTGYLICGLMGYLLGCINTAYIVGRFHGRDIRKAGSHNAGATNAAIVIGFKAGLIAAAGDIAKAAAAVALADLFFWRLEFAGLLAGACCMFGHAFPFWMNFHGGKGFASYLGLILALSGWLGFFLAIAVTAVITIVGDKLSLASISVMASYPVCMYFQGFDGRSILIVAAASVVMIYRHRGNIARMIRGEELGFRQYRARKASGERAEDDC